MRGILKRMTASLLIAVMVCATFLQWMPAMNVQAAELKKEMAHLVAGDQSGNGHFQNDATSSNPPEAFVLSETATFTDEAFSFMMKLGSESDHTRFRFVNKYVDDSNWSYVGYDCGEWKSQQMVGGNEDWSSAGAYASLPAMAKDDLVMVSGVYGDAGLTVTVMNLTQETEGVAVITDASFMRLASQEGKVGYGAAYRPNSGQRTDAYVVDTKVGETVLGYDDFAVYADCEGTDYTWELETVVIGDDGIEEEEAEARKWFVLTPGSGVGGHNYGQASGPLFYYDTEKVMEYGKSVSMAVKPNSNWGVFYGYVNDSNWFYIGRDNSSGWYYEYKINGGGSYASIAGLPDAVEGEELSIQISLSQETLTVTVNGVTTNTPNQAFLNWATSITASNGSLGKFGIMSKGNTNPISIADVKYDGANCMNDSWAFLVERSGQTVRVEETAMEPVTGTVKDSEGRPISGATVRVGVKSATTKIDGSYRIPNVQVGEYAISVSKPGYEAYSGTIVVEKDKDNVADIIIQKKADITLADYAVIESDDMTVYVEKEFPTVVRYVMKSDATGKTFFRGNEVGDGKIVINGTSIAPEVTIKEEAEDFRVYTLNVVNEAKAIDVTLDVKISVEANTLTWEVVSLEKAEGCARIASIDIPHLNLLTVDATEPDAVFAGAQASHTTTAKADTYITWEEGFVPSNEDGYLYAFLSNGKLSAGLHSNSEKEGDKRVERINGADSISLTSAVWYYESGDATTGQKQASYYDYQASELPIAKVAIADGDLNGDGDIDWNDGAIAFRDVMHYAQGTEAIKDIVNYRIVMNFESAAPNPFLMTADNVKKVYLATDGLPQALLLKGYGNEGHDSANSEYADIAEREGGVEDFQDLIKIAHDYNTEVGIHVNAQEAYPEARSFNETMISSATGVINSNGWGWLDQSVVINKLWDLASDARLKRFVQLYDRINETDFLSLDWEDKEYVKDSQGILTNGDGVTEVSRTEAMALVKADAATREDNMDFIYLDVWYQDAWETRRIAEEINSMGWRFSTEFSGEGEYDSTWQHWSTDTTYGGNTSKGFNSDIIRFLKNDVRDSQVLNWPAFGGTADNPLLGGFRLYGFEGWGGQQNFNDYLHGTFTENLPTKFLQHYEVIDWENYAEGESPVGNTEKQITLANAEGDVVVVTRNEEQRKDIEIERNITLNGKVVLNTDADEHVYLLPWIDNQNGEEKLYHWNLDGGTTTWDLQADWAALENVVVYELSDQGRINETEVAVVNGTVTLEAKASTAYVVVKGAALKELAADFGECENVVDPGFNGYADGAKLDAADWSGDIDAEGVKVVVSNNGDQRLEMTNTADEVSVTTKLTGLTVGEDYVAEIYVANESDARATMTVKTGKTVVSAYTDRSIAQNYISCDNEHGTKMNRIQVSFVAEAKTATFTLSRTAGEGYTHWDDIRIVEQKVDNYKEDGSFEQDFESVVQGLYPFVLGYNAGGDSRTHLAQLNAPYTQRGWNGKSVDDVLDGEWSLKHHTNITGLAYRTIPQNFRFEAGKVYNVEFDYQTASAGYQMIVGDGTTYNRPSEYLPATTTTKHVTMQVVGSGSGQTWIGLYMNGGMCYSDTAIGNVDFILDNLKITVDETAKVVTVSAKDLYLGEAADILGSSLDEITWTTSKDGIVEVDAENNKIIALAAGNVTVTATYGSGEVTTFEFTVEDSIASNISRDEFAGISISANTEETEGEGAVNGHASAVIDGDGSTFWHTAWQVGSFTVSQNHPAILTVDLGEMLEIGGFKFQQRNGNNGIVGQYSYIIKDAEGNVLTSGDHITTTAGSGEWVTQLFDEAVEAQIIEFRIEQGSNGFGCLAELEPIRVDKIATEATLADAKVEVGAKATLEAVPTNGDVLKGLVWTSSNPAVAKVSANGVVTGVKAGTAVITVSNALGELATCTVTVTGEAEGGVVRLSGTTRYETGYEVANTLKETLGVDKFEAVVVATGKNFADALAGSYLAVEKNAPIILTNGKADNIATLHAYIAENVVAGGKVYILGGEGAVPVAVEAIDGYEVVRLAGKSRYETNIAILEEAGISGDSIIVATGKTFADSLSASAAKLPILLVKPGAALSEEAKAIVKDMKNIYIIGGDGAVGADIASELANYGDVTRISGKSRYETSVAVAETFFGSVDAAVVASGKNFPDGLCGGPLAAAMNAPLILTADGKTAAAADYMAANAVESGYVLGGTGALAEESVVEVFGLE